MHVKTVVQSVIRRAGFELVPSWRMPQLELETYMRRLFETYNIGCVLDVGANTGQFALFVRGHVGFQGQIFSFEPVGSARERLLQAAKTDRNWIVRGEALGNEDAERDIYVMEEPRLNSFQKPDPDRPNQFRASNIIKGTERVKIRKLDSIFNELGIENGSRGVFLKVDTQGFDIEVLKGAQNLLKSIAVIQTEVSFHALYEGAPSYKETLDYMEQQNYRVSAFFPVASEPDMRAIEMDCFLINSAVAARIVGLR